MSVDRKELTDAIEKLSELYPKFMCILEEESV